MALYLSMKFFHKIYPRLLIYFLLFSLPQFLHSQYQVSQHFNRHQIDSIIVNPMYPFISILNSSGKYNYTGIEWIHSTEIPSFNNKGKAQFYFEDTVYAQALYQDGYLLGMDNGLQYYDGEKLRSFYVPLSDLKGKIHGISVCGDNFIIADEKNLFIWINESYSFQKISIIEGHYLTATSCDQWEYFWVSEGNKLYSIGPIDDGSLPYLKIIDFKNNESNYGDNFIEFDIETFHPSEKSINVSYQLSGLDSGWKNIVGRQNIRVENLPEGTFSLTARAGIDNKYFTYSNSIEVYRTSSEKMSLLWLLLGLPFVIILLSYYFIQREYKFKENLEKEKQKYQLQNEISQWKSQSHRLQMNPHFIFNALTGIQGLIATGDNVNARKYLQQFAVMMRSILSQNTLDNISLNKEINYLENYLQIEKMVRNNSFEFNIKNTADEDIMIPPMLIQPLIENAIIHGVSGMKNEGKISVTFMQQDQYLSCTIEDNGKGREAAEKSRDETKNNSIAVGLIEKRLANISKFKKGKLTYADLKDDAGNSIGTSVNLLIPIK